ncbi:MAG: hypothetical protein FWG14_13075, partial [Peptococcaceae bacterium]|nr:hypothetical protein [Peptococcaceae bacterium]
MEKWDKLDAMVDAIGETWGESVAKRGEVGTLYYIAGNIIPEIIGSKGTKTALSVPTKAIKTTIKGTKAFQTVARGAELFANLKYVKPVITVVKKVHDLPKTALSKAKN